LAPRGVFKSALDCIAVQQGPGTASTLIAVSGVTGGCGATTLAINLAYEIAYGHQVGTVLLDLSLRMGMLASYLNVEPRHSTSDLLRDSDRLDVYMVQQALTKVADNFHILAGPHRAITALEPTVEGVRRLIDFTRQLARVVVLDVPSTYDAVYFEALTVADRAVLVGEQSVPSVRALSLLRDALRREAPDLVQHPVINRYDPDREGFRAPDLAEFLRVPELVTIPADGEVVKAALDAGRPIRLQSPDSPALEAIDSLALAVVGRPAQQPVRPTSPSLLTRVVRRLGLA
jgi:pilus assembly protein CpaE